MSAATNDRLVLSVLRAFGAQSVAEMASRTGVSEAPVYGALKRLRAKGLKLRTRALDSIKRFLRTAGLECRREGNAIVAGGVLLRWDSAHLRWACTGKVGRATGTVFGVRLCAEMLAGEVV